MLISRIPIVDLKESHTIQKELLGINILWDMLKSREVIQTLLKVDFPFFLCLDFSSFNKENGMDQINNLISISFNPHYYKESKNPLLVFCSEKPINSGLEKMIHTAFINQGYAKLVSHQVLEGENSLATNAETLFVTRTKSSGELSSLIQSLIIDSIDKKLFIKIPIAEIEPILEQLKEEEILFEQSNKELYNSYKKIQELNSQNSNLTESNKRLEIKVLNFETNQKLLKEDASNVITWYKKEIDKIKSWYHKEYEVLPSWFKKIGHLIKRIK